MDVSERVKMERDQREVFHGPTEIWASWNHRTCRRHWRIARKLGWQFDIMSTSFFVSRRSLKPAAQSGMPLWQDHLFIAMSRSANDATDYFQILTGRVVEVGTQVTI